MNPKFYIYTICSLGCGLLLVVLGLILSFLPTSVETNVLLYEHRQLYDDWTSRPYTDVIIVDSVNGCPLEYEPLFHRMWNGTNEFCVSTTSENSLKLVSIREGSLCDGEVADFIPPINMTTISGKISCAKRGGPTFIE